jgi:hypothetical protein
MIAEFLAEFLAVFMAGYLVMRFAPQVDKVTLSRNPAEQPTI